MSLLYTAPEANDADLTKTGLQMFLRANVDPPQVCVLGLPGSGVLDGEPFSVVATGYVEAVDGADATVSLMSGDSTDATKNTVLGVSGAATCPAGKRVPWSIAADLLYIVETGTLTGEVRSSMAGIYSGPVTLDTPIVDIPTGTDPVIKFSVGVEATVSAAPPPQDDAPAPPDTPPTETGTVQWPVTDTDTDIALTARPTTVRVGSVFLIEQEYMTVTDISNPDNPGVERGAFSSTVAAHAAGLPVEIWGEEQPYIPPPPLPGTPEPLPPVTSTAVRLIAFGIAAA